MYETGTDVLCLCPFHSNKSSPALNISKGPNHFWKCHNGGCGEHGNLLSLLTKSGVSNYEARLLLQGQEISLGDFSKQIRDLLQDKTLEENHWKQDDYRRFQAEDRDNGFPGRQYLMDRGVEQRAYDFFGMGYSNKKQMLVIPIFDSVGKFVGVVGRSISSKRYQYSKGFNRVGNIWNLHRVAGSHSSIILTEGTLDAVYIWQAGFANVGAIFGSSVSNQQLNYCFECFDEVIVFADNDVPGQGLVQQFIERGSGLTVSTVQYPREDAKDPGELTKEEISSMIKNRQNSLYQILYN